MIFKFWAICSIRFQSSESFKFASATLYFIDLKEME